jgi:hypothetical protein
MIPVPELHLDTCNLSCSMLCSKMEPRATRKFCLMKGTPNKCEHNSRPTLTVSQCVKDCFESLGYDPLGKYDATSRRDKQCHNTKCYVTSTLPQSFRHRNLLPINFAIHPTTSLELSTSTQEMAGEAHLATPISNPAPLQAPGTAKWSTIVCQIGFGEQVGETEQLLWVLAAALERGL